MLASAPRLNRGMQARPGTEPEELLELYSFESSPYARLVRERLCEMEIPYVLRNCGRSLLSEWLLPPVRSVLRITPKSELENRRQLLAREGKLSIPYLVDPNTDSGLFESAKILDYLQQNYGS